MTDGDSMVARRHLATLEDIAIRDEIDPRRSLRLREQRLRCFTHPKYRTADE
ncbi:hypothetical protein [Bradyrhizobium sp. SBR1B]|uniref:hypothetical protein n=1 Tax=Bradyrhizobium sp. SBR1B TaxID=2663836 RepID=UPI00160601E5|nr:hypothetical protein [Bradyrhizobium sp. SBR1B]MBB4377073.1 hypothetical protein [Bradyrhizobium sp. SBR1B]